MAETMQMQLNEFEAVESPLPMGLKIPKMPSTTDDIAGEELESAVSNRNSHRSQN